MTSAERYQLIRSLVDRKNDTYSVPKLPPANPDDFYQVRNEEELAAVLAEIEKQEAKK
jgi:hypothetical protein